MSDEFEQKLQELFRAAGFDWRSVDDSTQAMIRKNEGGGWNFLDRDPTKDEALFVNALAAVVLNLNLGKEDMTLPRFMAHVEELLKLIDKEIHISLNDVIGDERFREIERNWRMLADIAGSVSDSERVEIDVLDVTKEELAEDVRDNANHIMSSSMFQRMYVGEFDSYGGVPFSAMVALFEFDPSQSGPHGDLHFLRGLGKLASHCHAPFVGAVGPSFFNLKSFDQLGDLDQLDRLLERPRYGEWDAFRDEHEAAYIGLTLPRYLLRKPYHQNGESKFRFDERLENNSDYLWGNSAALFARNMIRSFELSGWCQHVRGPKGGGLIEGMPVHEFEVDGHWEAQPPVDASLPDYRELQLATAGFISLLCKKDKPSDVCFFSAQSAKKAKEFIDEIDTQNAHLVTNLSYTLSVSRIAHYIKLMVREYIGSTADGPYIQNMLQTWLADYVTTVTNPDDKTLTRYPFKAVSVEVAPKVGALGWYKCTASILPHIQFEGMDVELRLEASLGG